MSNGLTHPNTKLFITHGGLLSTIETVYHGVPVLAIPIFGDQKMNAARAEMNGFGISLSFSAITEEKLSEALNKLLNDPNVKCSRILVVFPMPAPSHYILGNALARGLAEAGHDITMHSFNFFDLEHMSPFLNIPFMNFVGNNCTQKTLEHPNFKKLIKSNEHFDVVILEQFHDDALKVLGYHYKAPLILFSTIGASSWINPLVGNPAPPSYIPDIFLKYTSNMTFWQRMVNWIFALASELNRQLIFFPKQNQLMKEYFPDAPDLSILNYNASLVLVNSHESINQPAPHVPNMIDIGGFHVNPPKELPTDLKDFMDNAEEGVVYFSMGSNIKPSTMSNEKKEAILKALGKIKQKVLWKWDEDDVPGKPANVKLAKWFPQ
ncbi:hypothetical protein NQ314_018639 [Rhamnusium bicolor]|uniref:Uncharacterized protein n=1 Tax=Rhamnusium bicolor TaxID=1586634 RepID=A0AAV8WSP8_9CUCU|nr:hypothetical protein NQ314_018639 [Rhamnusium bicolor]